MADRQVFQTLRTQLLFHLRDCLSAMLNEKFQTIKSIKKAAVDGLTFVYLPLAPEATLSSPRRRERDTLKVLYSYTPLVLQHHISVFFALHLPRHTIAFINDAFQAI